MSEITVAQLQKRVDDWYQAREKADELKELLSAANLLVDSIGSDLIRMMDELGIEKFEGPMGKVRVHTDESISMPADDEKRAAFVDYLKEIGEWDNFATIHHHKLQAWHKAKQEEHGAFFMAPGLDLPKVRKSIRKTK